MKSFCLISIWENGQPEGFVQIKKTSFWSIKPHMISLYSLKDNLNTLAPHNITVQFKRYNLNTLRKKPMPKLPPPPPPPLVKTSVFALNPCHSHGKHFEHDVTVCTNHTFFLTWLDENLLRLNNLQHYLKSVTLKLSHCYRNWYGSINKAQYWFSSL